MQLNLRLSGADPFPSIRRVTNDRTRPHRDAELTTKRPLRDIELARLSGLRHGSFDRRGYRALVHPCDVSESSGRSAS